jgi:hypothetical protein
MDIILHLLIGARPTLLADMTSRGYKCGGQYFALFISFSLPLGNQTLKTDFNMEEVRKLLCMPR